MERGRSGRPAGSLLGVSGSGREGERPVWEAWGVPAGSLARWERGRSGRLGGSLLRVWQGGRVAGPGVLGGPCWGSGRVGGWPGQESWGVLLRVW